jgi:4-hydroxybenzoate polyprenyltransferase
MLDLIKILRPIHWIKNVFVLAPLFFTPDLINKKNIEIVIYAFVCFCLISSAVYVINDIRDKQSDKKHPVKKHRPIASGKIATPTALIVFFLTSLFGLGLGFYLNFDFFIILLSYFIINIFYSFGLKQVSIIDIMIISLGFILRVEAGSIVLGISPSVWIIVCTGLLSLFLAVAKRRDDIIKQLKIEHRKSLIGYSRYYLDIILAFTLGALLVSYMIYTTDKDVMQRMGSDKLYLTAPFVLAGILRYLQITIVEEKSGSPTIIALSDKFMVITILGWLATFSWLIYF